MKVSQSWLCFHNFQFSQKQTPNFWHILKNQFELESNYISIIFPRIWKTLKRRMTMSSIWRPVTLSVQRMTSPTFVMTSLSVTPKKRPKTLSDLTLVIFSNFRVSIFIYFRRSIAYSNYAQWRVHLIFVAINCSCNCWSCVTFDCLVLE